VTCNQFTEEAEVSLFQGDPLQDLALLERLRAETGKFYPRGEEIATEHLGEMDYPEAGTNEALRRPLAPALRCSPRAVMHPDPFRG
jgi:hypothetical protein